MTVPSLRAGFGILALGAGLVGLAGCGGADDDRQPAPGPDTAGPAGTVGTARSAPPTRQGALGVALPAVAVSQADAVRLAQQATFGPRADLLATIQAVGVAGWVRDQMQAVPASSYVQGGSSQVHAFAQSGTKSYCNVPPQSSDANCGRDNISTRPLTWDFFINATTRPDQLRQRIAFTLGQRLPVSGVEIDGTYGFRNYHNALLNLSFGNYRDVLRMVATSPLMGEYLDNVNNDPQAPNENFARELLQLFSLGTCELELDGTLVGGACKPVYTNDTVRNYAYALTGWTYPAGSGDASNTQQRCGGDNGARCRFYEGEMTPLAALRDTAPRKLLSNVSVPAQTDAAVALERVLDSLMKHQNIAPFIARWFIQGLVASNPSPAYVSRVAAAFKAGRYTSSYDGTPITFGAKKAGDLKATVAAALLDAEARDPAVVVSGAGQLRSPVLLFTGAVRALNGFSDGVEVSSLWGWRLRQQPFNAPTVFGDFAPDFPVAGTALRGPEFGIHGVDAALARLNYLRWVIYTGSLPDPGIPGATGTQIDLSAFLPNAADPAALVDQIANLLLGQPLAGLPREKVITAVEWENSTRYPLDWATRRGRNAAYLVMASPQYQVQR